MMPDGTGYSESQQEADAREVQQAQNDDTRYWRDSQVFEQQIRDFWGAWGLSAVLRAVARVVERD